MYSNISKNFQNKTCTILFNYSYPLSQHFHDCIVFKIIFKIKHVFRYSHPLSQHFQDCIVFKIIFKIKHVLRYSYLLSQYFQDY